MKTHLLSALVRISVCASALAATFAANHAFAQAPGRTDKIMTRDELRACMKLEQTNKTVAAEILQEQDAFKRDQEAIKAEQAGVATANDDIRARSAAIAAERDAMSARVSELAAMAESAKTDAEKAHVEAQRTKLIEGNRLLEQNIDSFNRTQQAQRDRVDALNQRIDPINQRNRTINARVEPHQKQAATWRDLCGNRRFREEDEIVIRKDLAAGK